MSDEKVVNFAQQREQLLASTRRMARRDDADPRIARPLQRLHTDYDTAKVNLYQSPLTSEITIPHLLARAKLRRLQAPAAPGKQVMRIPPGLLTRLSAMDAKPENPFSLPAFPPKAQPPDADQKMAMDDFPSDWSFEEWSNYQARAIGGALQEGMAFPGYAYLAELAQRPEYRKFAEILATEMTRKWIEFTSTNTETEKSTTYKIKQLEKRCDELRVRDAFRRCLEIDEFFGRSHLYIDTGDTDNRDELKTTIGQGRDEASKAKITKGKLKALRPVEPVWCYPTSYDANDPLTADWYEPRTWFVMGKEVHCTRLLKFVGREVPDLLKPAYSFGGLSMTQMAKPYVDNWLRTRQSVSDLVHAYSVFVLSTDLGSWLTESGDELIKRVDMFNKFRDNRGLMVLNKETETFQNVSAQIGGLEALQAQSQEQLCSVASIPVVKYLGIQPTGLNASDEGGIRMFYDWIAAQQEKRVRHRLTTVVDFVQLDLWGEINEDIGYKFVPLYELDELQKADLRNKDMQTDVQAIDAGVLTPEEVRQRVAADPDSPHASIDVDDVPDLSQEESEGLDPRSGGTGGKPKPPHPQGGGAGGPEGQPQPKPNPNNKGQTSGNGGWEGGDEESEDGGNVGHGNTHFVYGGGPKLTHEKAGYEHHTMNWKDRCGTCQNFISDGEGCERVEDPISPHGWCKIGIAKTDGHAFAENAGPPVDEDSAVYAESGNEGGVDPRHPSNNVGYSDETEPSEPETGRHMPNNPIDETFGERVAQRENMHDAGKGSFYERAGQREASAERNVGRQRFVRQLSLKARQALHDLGVGSFYDKVRGREQAHKLDEDSRGGGEWGEGQHHSVQHSFYRNTRHREAEQAKRETPFHQRVQQREAAHNDGKGSFYDRAEAREVGQHYKYRAGLKGAALPSIKQHIEALRGAQNEQELLGLVQAMVGDPSLTRAQKGTIADIALSDALAGDSKRGSFVGDESKFDETKIKRDKGGKFTSKGGGGGGKEETTGKGKSKEVGPGGVKGTTAERVDLRKQIKNEKDATKREEMITKLRDSYELGLRLALTAGNTEKAESIRKRLEKLGGGKQVETIEKEVKKDLKQTLPPKTHSEKVKAIRAKINVAQDFGAAYQRGAEEIADIFAEAAASLGLHEDMWDKLAVRSDEPTFELNGKQCYYAGMHRRNQINWTSHEIAVFPKQCSPYWAVRVVSHEIMHNKFTYMMNVMNRELDKARVAGDLEDFGNRLKPGKEQDYPRLTKILKNFWHVSVGVFAETDGVTSYSTDWWINYSNDRSKSQLAIEETLCEMACEHYAEKSNRAPTPYGHRILRYKQPPMGGYNERERERQTESGLAWQRLYDTVNEIYDTASDDK